MTYHISFLPAMLSFRRASLLTKLWLVFFFTVVPVFAYAAIGQKNGPIWKTLTSYERTLYLGGLQEGFFELSNLMWLFDGTLPSRDSEEMTLIDQLKLTDEQKSLIVRIIDNRFRQIYFGSFGSKAIADIMAKLYNDPSNNFVGFNDIAKIAVMMLQGKPEENVKNELENCRRGISELMRRKHIKP